MAEEAGTTTGGAPGTEGTTAPAAPATNGATEPAWYAPVESLKESDPETWKSFEKSIASGAHKDMPSVVKHLVGLEKKLGSAINLPSKDKPDEVKALKQKLQQAGILAAPPESADKYELKLDAIPEPVRSNDLMSEFRALAHEEGFSQETVSKLAGFYEKMFTTTVEPALKYTQQQAEQAITDYAKEIGKEPAIVKQYGGAWLAKHFTEDEMKELERIGAANSPTMIKYACRAGMDTGEDISVIEGTQGATDNEYETMMEHLADPNHIEHKMFHAKGIDAQDPKRLAFMQRREEILRRKFGTGEPKAG